MASIPRYVLNYRCSAPAHGLGDCGLLVDVVNRDANGFEWYSCAAHAGFSTSSPAPIKVTRIEEWYAENALLDFAGDPAAFERERALRKREAANAALEGAAQLERLGAALEEI